MLRVVTICLLVMLFCLIAGGAQAMYLTHEGQSDYQIVISAQASQSQRFAAEELQRFVKEMSGATLPIVEDTAPLKDHEVLLGDNAHLRQLGFVIDWKKLGKEGFTLRTRNGRLIIAGSPVRGTLYGVYTLLEDYFGCRWFTAKISRIPKQPTLKLPGHLDDTQVLIFEYREPFFTEAFDGDWAARNRMNSTNARLGPKHGGKVVYSHFVHTFYSLVPPSEYAESHPEYFALVDGKRKTSGAQLCLSNPDVRRIALDRLRQWIKEAPTADIYSVSQNDCWGYCQCDNCKAIDEREGSPMGSVLNFVNYLAGQIAKEYPDKAIDTLAYQYTRKPPKYERPLPNVIIRLCSIECCFTHPLATCDSGANKAFCKDIREWHKICNRLYIWDYVTDFANYWLPFPNYYVLQPNIKFFSENGVKGIFEEGAYPEGGGGEMAELKSYILAKALWNPDYPTEKAITEFCHGVYGAGAKYIIEYLHMMRDKVEKEDIHGHIWESPKARYLSKDVVQKADELFQQALKATADAPVAHREVEKAYIPILYVRCAQMGKEAPGFRPLAEQLFKLVEREGYTQWREGHPVSELKRDWLGE